MATLDAARDAMNGLRVSYPGAMYHIMDRGDRQERIFQWLP